MAGLILSGIADEASPDLAGQLDTHAEAGWSSIELRTIGGVNVCEMDDVSFEAIVQPIRARGFSVPCVASAIANWGRAISGEFSRDTADLRRSAPRMRRLGTCFVRIMSWPNDGLAPEAWRAEALRRLRELARIADGEDVVLVLENCSGWASQSPDNLRAAVEETGSRRIRILFDTGNAVADGGNQEDSWRFYQAARPFIAHVHVKDCLRRPTGETTYTWPGDGWGMVPEILSDLLVSGYEGAVSIEPHISGQIHKGTAGGEAVNARQVYLEYARRTEAILDGLAGLRRG